MRLRRLLKGDTRRAWRTYKAPVSAFLLATAIVTAVAWILR
jgi:hypothetical protein